MLQHSNEILIAGDTHTKISIVSVPFLLGNGAVLISSQAIEGVKEIVEDLVRSLFSLDNLRILRGVIYIGNICSLNRA